jgi:hypothetical protein
MKKILLALLILLSLACKFNTKKVSLSEDSTRLKITPQLFIQELPDKLNETSGLIFFDNLLWTINDSGGKNKVYGFNLNGKIKREVEINDADNYDWESLTQDKEHIYIGDTGNNRGNRNNQSIYKINKKSIKKKESQEVKSKKLKIDFEDQTDYNSNPKTPYDCEAMVELNDALYLFTKNRKNFSTTVYKAPKKNGEYKLNPLENFKVDALITGADISPDEKTLALIAYQNGKPILWLFSDISPDNFFKGQNSRYELDLITGAQTEGICFLNNDSIAISCERNKNYKQQVFLIDLNAKK